MNISEIISDSLRYPFRDWKKILFLGIIVLFSNITDISYINVVLSSVNSVILYVVAILGYLIGFLGRGYTFRIVKSSLTDVIELPRFINWVEMFVEGLKVTIVGWVYALPLILIMLVFVAINFNFALGIIGSDPSSFVTDLILGSGIWGLIAILYLIIMLPIWSIAIANMANNNSKLSSAFRIKEIVNKISSITWSKLIKWYIVSLIILCIMVITIVMILSPIGISVERLIINLVVAPYFYMYIFRSTALIYISEENSEN